MSAEMSFSVDRRNLLKLAFGAALAQTVKPLSVFAGGVSPDAKDFSSYLTEKYLKVSRLIKRRTVANDACDTDRILVNGKVAKASYSVKLGDLITVSFGQKSVTVRVLEIKETTKKTECVGMYEVVSEQAAE